MKRKEKRHNPEFSRTKLTPQGRRKRILLGNAAQRPYDPAHRRSTEQGHIHRANLLAPLHSIGFEHQGQLAV